MGGARAAGAAKWGYPVGCEPGLRAGSALRGAVSRWAPAGQREGELSFPLLPGPPKVNFAAPSAALPSPRRCRAAAVREEPSCVRASFPAPARALCAMDATALERDAVQFARLAVQRDHEGRYSEAVFYYKVGLGPPLWSELLSRSPAWACGQGAGSRCRGSGPGFPFPSFASRPSSCWERRARLQRPRLKLRSGGTGSRLAATASPPVVLTGRCPRLSRFRGQMLDEGS